MPSSGERGENFAYGKMCFLQEAETLAKFIGNENIVRIYSYFEEYGTAYFVMDFIEGTTLEEFIKAHGGKLSFVEMINILVPVMDALAAVHDKGIIHRDISPDNIYLTSDGNIKLIDFGAARQSLGDRSQSLDVVLKHGFAPKEQYTRRGRQGPYTDIYALGATAYFALTGKRPPDSLERLDEDDIVSPSALGVKLSREAEEAILMALNVQPGDRFQSMTAFKNAILSVHNQVREVAEPISPATLQDSQDRDISRVEKRDAETKERVERKDRNRTVKRMAIASLVVIAIVVFCGFLVFKTKNGEGKLINPPGKSLYPVIIGNNVNNLTERSMIYVDSDAPGTVLFGRVGGKGRNAAPRNRFSCISIVDGKGYAMDGGGMAVTFDMNGTEASNLQYIPELSEFNDIARLYISEDYYYIYTINESSESHFYSINRTDGSLKESRIKDLRACEITFTDSGKFCYIDWDGETGLVSLYYTPAGAIDQVAEPYYTIPDKFSGSVRKQVLSGNGDIVYIYLWTDNGLNKIYRFDLSKETAKDPQVTVLPDDELLYDMNYDGENMFYERKDEETEGYTVGTVDLSSGNLNPIYETTQEPVGLTVYPGEKGKASFFVENEVVTVP